MKRVVLPIVFALTLASFGLSAYFFSGVYKTSAAGAMRIITGYAWSSNIGWISLSCQNEAPSTCGTEPDYQVKINAATGTFGGYAWSPNIGWIRFDPPPDPATGRYPEDPQSYAKLVAVNTPNGSRNQIQGWARACAPLTNNNQPGDTCGSAVGDNSGVWDGWIKMSNGLTTNCPNYFAVPPETGPYETCVTGDGANLSGYAWGGDVLGWIQFNPAMGGNRIINPAGRSQIIEIKPR